MKFNDSQIKMKDPCGLNPSKSMKVKENILIQKEDEVEDKMSLFSVKEEKFVWILLLGEKEVKSSFDEKEKEVKDKMMLHSEEEEEFL